MFPEDQKNITTLSLFAKKSDKHGDRKDDERLRRDRRPLPSRLDNDAPGE